MYLDSYDYSKDREVQIKSQQHHLEEFKAIEDRLHNKTIVLIDDCDLPNGGKGKMVVEYMLLWSKKLFRFFMKNEGTNNLYNSGASLFNSFLDFPFIFSGRKSTKCTAVFWELSPKVCHANFVIQGE